MNENVLVEAIDKERNSALHLARTKWAEFTEGVSDERASLMARMFESQSHWMGLLSEDTRVSNVGTFNRYIFPLIQAFYANTIAPEVVSVQPLKSQTSEIFYRDVRFGSDKGSVRKGQLAFSSRTGWNEAAGHDFTSERVPNEVIGAGDGTDLTPLSATASLQLHPLRPGTVTITYTASDASTKTLTDDGSGGFTGAAGELGSGNTIDYNTGALLLTFDTGKGPAIGPITATYEYVSELSEQIPQLDIVITSIPVTAHPRKLRARWSEESAMLLKSVYGTDAEVDLLNDMSNEIKIEMDRHLIAEMLILANANNTNGVVPEETFAKTPPTNVSLYMHRQSFIYSVTALGNKIYRANRRFMPNFMIAGINVANIVQGQQGINFQSEYNLQGSGVQYIGVLNGMYRVYLDPYMDPDTAIVGYKGSGSMLDAGLVFAPWIMFYATPTVVLDDFIARKGLMSSYAIKAVNGLFYGKLRLT